MSREHDLFDPEGLERALARAEQDPRASEELDFVADLVAAAELERKHLARPPERAVEQAPLLGRPWILAAAASVLFLLALGAWFLSRDGERRTLQSLALADPPRFVAAELRDPEASLADAFAAAMEPYTRGDWAGARRALEEWLSAHPEHGPAHFYLAAACEALGDGALAEQHYELAARAPDALLADHARLRLALLWLQRGELERARAQLAVLSTGEGELARNARELLDEISELERR